MATLLPTHPISFEHGNVRTCVLVVGKVTRWMDTIGVLAHSGCQRSIKHTRTFQASLTRRFINCMITELDGCVVRRWVYSKLVAFLHHFLVSFPGSVSIWE